MIKKNFIIYSMLSFALLSSTAMAMEEKAATEEVRRGAPGKLSIEVTNDTGDEHYRFTEENIKTHDMNRFCFRNFRIRIALGETDTTVQFPRAYLLGELKKLDVSWKIEGLTEVVQENKATNTIQYLTAYVSSDYEDTKTSRPISYAFGCVELNLGSPVEVEKVKVNFGGIKYEQKDESSLRYIPLLSFQINGETEYRFPQKLIKVTNNLPRTTVTRSPDGKTTTTTKTETPPTVEIVNLISKE